MKNQQKNIYRDTFDSSSQGMPAWVEFNSACIWSSFLLGGLSLVLGIELDIMHGHSAVQLSSGTSSCSAIWTELETLA